MNPLTVIAEGLMRDRSALLAARNESVDPTLWRRYDSEIAALDVRIERITDALLTDIRGYWTKDGAFHEGMPPAGEPNPEWRTPEGGDPNV